MLTKQLKDIEINNLKKVVDKARFIKNNANFEVKTKKDYKRAIEEYIEVYDYLNDMAEKMFK